MRRAPEAPFRSRSGALEIHQVPVWQDNVVWLLADAKGQAAAVDGPEASPIRDYCQAHDLTLTTILNTHTHGDHIGINLELEAGGQLSSLRVVGAARATPAVPGLTEPVDDGSSVEFGGVVGRVMRTEGHIDRHLSYVFEDLLFCGDTLFAGGCGYLFDGPPSKMHDSLQRLAALPEETRVCCAHEYTQDNLRFAWSVEPGNLRLAERIRRVWAQRDRGESSLPGTIREELATNPFLRVGEPEIIEALRRLRPNAQLDGPESVFTALRALKDEKHYREAPDSVLPL